MSEKPRPLFRMIKVTTSFIYSNLQFIFQGDKGDKGERGLTTTLTGDQFPTGIIEGPPGPPGPPGKHKYKNKTNFTKKSYNYTQN